MGESCGHGGAAAPGDLIGERHRLGRARHLEGKLDAAAGQILHRLHRVVFRGIDRVRGAELARESIDTGAARDRAERLAAMTSAAKGEGSKK